MIDEKIILEQTEQLKQSQFADERFVDGVTAVETLIKFAPKTGEWIPCEVAMPTDTDATYIVTVKDMRNGNEYVTTDSLYKYKKRTLGASREYDWLKDCSYQKVLAWQPLPQPYKEGGIE